MNPYIKVFGVISCISVLIALLLSAIRRRTGHGRGEGEVLNGSIFSLFAALYAFFLGFCVVTLWGTFGAAKTIVTAEATDLLSAHYLSRSFDEGSGLRKALAAYVQCVINDEWPAMDRVSAMHPQAQHLLNQIWDAFRALKPANKEDNTLYANLSSLLVDVSRQRGARALYLDGNIYPPIWVILFFGFWGICVGLFFTNPNQHPGQTLLEIVVVFTVLSCIYFIYDINTPFSGFLNVPPDAFTNVLNRMAEMSPGTIPAPAP
ncbi:MAG TPA: DUF4239 domain-containing protein [Holophaga sp.]|nr:DUF4239 domain-containing protein [Holophaga sp.]